MAAAGMKPVVELMFIDFLGVCFDQIFNQAAKFRYMFGGKVKTPVVINGVQHVVHPPMHLNAWPSADRRSRIIFIVRDIERQRIEESLEVFNAIGSG